MKKCSFCGELIPITTEICPWCGRPDKKMFPKNYNRVANDKRAPKNNKENILKQIKDSLSSKKSLFFKKQKNNNLIALITVILILCLLLVFSLFYKNSLPSYSTSPNKNSLSGISITSSPLPTSTPIPTNTPIPTPTITPSGNIDVFRIHIFEGPSDEFDELPESLFLDEIFTVLGKSEIPSWIQIETQQGIVGWVQYEPENMLITIPIEDIRISYFRPESYLIKSPTKNGSNQLLIRNDSHTDAIVIMIMNKNVYSVAYIRKGENFKINNIRPDEYMIFYSTGENWNGKIFTKNVTRGKFVESFKFSEHYYSYENWDISLSTSNIGNARVINVGEEQFPDF